MTEWQPVETMPKDGTWILLRGRNSAAVPMIPVVVAWRVGEGRAVSVVAWRESVSLRDVSYMALDKGAEWAPLP